MDIYQAEMQLSAAKHLRWMPDTIDISAKGIYIDGWVLSVWEDSEQTRFLLNGKDFAEVIWPVESPDIKAHFNVLPNTNASRFRCWQPLEPGEMPYENGFLRFNVTGQFGEHRKSYRTAWFISDPDLEVAAPSAARIERVIGTNHLGSFKLGGATTLNRLEQLLFDRFDRPLSTFKSVLDWGCGAGRLTRYLTRRAATVTGVDIDADNIRGCAETITSAHFQLIDLYPPMPFASSSFDLVIGISVMTHLKESVQHAWLAELNRIVESGGLVLLSIQGMAQSALYRTSSEQLQAVQRQGILYTGNNSQLDQVVDATNYYVDVMHSHEYVMASWSEHFEVLEIIEAIASNQDLVLMRKR
ncbi:class I SAM-dependent methyltransferase [Nitrincola sp.]|uniref:class I SAM-dependent methyltransferase n=1 Tax=Nitrincola sp. TaxID=1926584 RepID=UPI003A8CEF80